MLAHGFDGQARFLPNNRVKVTTLQDYIGFDASYAGCRVFADPLDTPKTSLANKGRCSKRFIESSNVPSTGRKKNDFSLAGGIFRQWPALTPSYGPLLFQSDTFFLGQAPQTLKLRRRPRRPGLCPQRSPALERRARCPLRVAGGALQQTTQRSPRLPRGLQTRPVEDIQCGRCGRVMRCGNFAGLWRLGS